MDMVDVGKMIRYHRKMADLSQEALAKLAGLGKTVIYDIEAGKQSIKFSTLLKLFEVLNISVIYQSPLMKQFEKD